MQLDLVKDVAVKPASLPMASGDFISMVLSQPDSAEKVQLLRELIAMQNAEKARQSKEQFEIAFARMRGELPAIKKTKEVTRSGGQHMYNYAPLEHIQKICDPILQRHGFSYSWREDAIENGKRVWFDLFGYGYTKSNYFDAPMLAALTSRDGGTIANAVQTARMTSSYAKRNSMVDGLGLIIEGEDNDASTVDMPEDLKKAIEAISLAANSADLINVYQAAYKKYEKDINQQRLIVGEYNLAKQRLAKVGTP